MVSPCREQGYVSRGLYYMIKGFEERGRAQFRPITGRSIAVATKINCNKVRKCLINTNNSVNETPITLQISRGSVVNIKRKLKIKAKKYQVQFWPDMARIPYIKVVKLLRVS